MATFPKLTRELTNKLQAIVPSRDGGMLYYPCRVRLRNGSAIDHVYVSSVDRYLATWGVLPQDDAAKREVRVEELVDLEESPDRLPVHLANELYAAGESAMGGCFFELAFADHSKQAYETGNAVDFLPLPPGKSWVDAVAVLPHQRGTLENRLKGLPYSWCLFASTTEAV